MPKTLIEQKPTFTKKVEGEDKLAIAEMFCDTIQGEGISAGIISTFIRLQGCTLKCAWCFPKGTSILMSDFTYKDISNIKKGDIIKSYEGGLIDVLVEESTKTRNNRTIKITTENNNQIISTPDHKIVYYDENSSKKKIGNAEDLLGKYVKIIPSYKFDICDDEVYQKGYLKGVTLGDCNIQLPYRIKLECLDYEMIESYSNFIKNIYNYKCNITQFKNKYFRTFISKKDIVSDLIIYPSEKEMRGFIAGFFDSEGHIDKNLNFSQKDPKILYSIKEYLEKLNFKCSISSKIQNSGVYLLNVLGGFDEKVRFITYFQPKIKRKEEKIYQKHCINNKEKIIKIEEDKVQDVYSLKTSQGYYIANNFWVKNCDTLDVWSQGNEYSFTEIFEMFENANLIEKFKYGQHLVLTGGSPLKQEERLINFLWLFEEKYGFLPYIEIENEAVLEPKGIIEYIDQWNNSPKLSNSGMKEKVRVKPKVLERLNSIFNSWFKFVISKKEDWDEIEKNYLPYISKDSIILMPEGQTQEELQKTRAIVADLAIENGVRFTDRLHVTIWNKKTGV